MSYMVYNYDESETLFDIADAFGVTVSELARINNIQEPFNPRPYYIEGLDGTIIVPETQTGGKSDDDINASEIYRELSYDQQRRRRTPTYGAIGFASQHKCYIIIQGETFYFPCFPESYSDTHEVSIQPQEIMGRSEPFQIYKHTGPRSVSVRFKMHREMNHALETDIDELVGALQSAIYPMGLDSIIPRVELVIGNNCYIKGIITSNIDTTWSETINKNTQYNMVEIGFTVTECTGQPKTAMQVRNLRGV